MKKFFLSTAIILAVVWYFFSFWSMIALAAVMGFVISAIVFFFLKSMNENDQETEEEYDEHWELEENDADPALARNKS